MDPLYNEWLKNQHAADRASLLSRSTPAELDEFFATHRGAHNGDLSREIAATRASIDRHRTTLTMAAVAGKSNSAAAKHASSWLPMYEGLLERLLREAAGAGGVETSP